MDQDTDTMDKLVDQRYIKAIDYYWKASRQNKRAYKLTRTLVIVLGALVTLISSLSSAQFIRNTPGWNLTFAIGTPMIAAALTIVGGFSQTFQWGAAWQDMVLTAQRLQKERDRFLVTKPEDRDLTEEMALLNDFVLVESQGFFERMLGSAKPVQPQAGAEKRPDQATDGKPILDQDSD